ncbi:putative transcription factor [Corchorus olitorius]|uniref:Transcription factor n=1 Tax=Corchorus olitorius TaxID=93759 RepID=A0A1R3I8T6_9ROSI|nr:putative transcription factor [Corchorus olitorius]
MLLQSLHLGFRFSPTGEVILQNFLRAAINGEKLPSDIFTKAGTHKRKNMMDSNDFDDSIVTKKFCVGDDHDGLKQLQVCVGNDDHQGLDLTQAITCSAGEQSKLMTMMISSIAYWTGIVLATWAVATASPPLHSNNNKSHWCLD